MMDFLLSIYAGWEYPRAQNEVHHLPLIDLLITSAEGYKVHFCQLRKFGYPMLPWIKCTGKTHRIYCYTVTYINIQKLQKSYLGKFVCAMDKINIGPSIA